MKMGLSDKITIKTLVTLVMLMAIGIPTACHHENIPQDVITKNEDYTVGADSVTEGRWTAHAIGSNHLITNYQGLPLMAMTTSSALHNTTTLI